MFYLILYLSCCTCATWQHELDPPRRLFSHVSCPIAAVNNLLSDLFIRANSAGSLTPITLLVECLFWTTSRCFALKSILLQNQQMFLCGSTSQHPLMAL